VGNPGEHEPSPQHTIYRYEKEQVMRISPSKVFAVFAVLLVALMGGCTSNAQPQDEDIIKAINDSEIIKANQRFTVVPPIIISERGQQNKDGSWPVKVTLTITYKMNDGRTSPPTQTMTSFRIIRAKDNGGRPGWRAQLGA
jgi:hypothetical protein